MHEVRRSAVREDVELTADESANIESVQAAYKAEY
jgi:hypothetical protein